ncbi:MAG: lytic transglycosylase domain-containing protein [Chthoniobacterales bacterium]
MRFVLKFLICGLLALAAGATYLALRSGDTAYTLYEWISPGRFHQQDELIRQVASQHGVDPMLIKAVVWRESRFNPQKFGSAGERGLMQVTERAASEWARETHLENFHGEELFDPKTNLQAGSWYLARAMQHWKAQADPVPFALAEYNAGASRALRWAGGDERLVLPPDTFRANIDFPGTRKYVDAVIARFDFYKRRGRM